MKFFSSVVCIYSLLFFISGYAHAHASTCVDLASNVSRYQENKNVLALQNFLLEKGYLKAKPNGYFGGGTFSALKAYQKANNITQTGTAGPFTRALIKKESCASTSTVSTAPPTTTTQVTTQATTSKPATVATPTPSNQVPAKVLTKNEQRMNDGEIILKALYSYFNGSRGVWPVASASSSVELCVAPKITQMAVMTMATDTAMTVKTPDSPCASYVDISYLIPQYAISIPRDPTLATSSVLTGYTITRGLYGDITISPKVTDNKEIVRVRCNFTLGCSYVKRMTQEEYAVPSLTSINQTFLLKDATHKNALTITGENFTTSNTVLLQSKVTQRSYTLGTFPSTNKTTITLPATTTTDVVSCGDTCRQKLPLGDYSVWVRNEGGESNLKYLTIKGFTSATISSHADTTVPASTTNVKVATISLSTSIPVTITSLTLLASSTSVNLPAKITNFKAKDNLGGTTISASGLTFSLGNTALAENNSRFYDIYVDTKDVLTHETGLVTYGGSFLVKDTLTGGEITLPIKEFSFSVSP